MIQRNSKKEAQTETQIQRKPVYKKRYKEVPRELEKRD